MNTTNLSIIIPVFNAAHFLNRCLDSIRIYAKRDIKTIVIDDGSTDETLIRLMNYQKQHPSYRLQVIHQNHQGVSVARNNGLQHASGKFVTFVDSDDQLEPQWYKNLFPYFSSHFDIISFRMINASKNGKTIDQTIPIGKITPTKMCEFYCSSDALNSACARLITIKSIKHTHASFKPGLGMGEDALFMGQLIKDNVSFFQSNIILYRYISNPISSTHTTTCLDYDPSLILTKYHLSFKLSHTLQIKCCIFLLNSFTSSIRAAVRNGNVSWQELQEHVPHYWQSTHMTDICQHIEPYLDLRHKIEFYLIAHNHYRLLRFELGAEIFIHRLLLNN